MKKIGVLFLIVILHSLCSGQELYPFLNYFDSDYFRIRNSVKNSERDVYIGKTVIFYEPISDEQRTVNLKKIKYGIPYIIKDIQIDKNAQVDEKSVTFFLTETNDPKAKPIKIKCTRSLIESPTIDDIPMYIKDYYDEALQTFVGTTLIYKGEPHKIIGINWHNLPCQTKDCKGDRRYSFFVYENIKNGSKSNESMNTALSGSYQSSLTKVEKPSNESIRYGETTTITDDSITRYSYTDNVIDIIIYGEENGFAFNLKNVSDNSIKIIWNEAVFVGVDGTTSKIMHSSTKYSQKNEDQPATVIIHGAKITDIAIPTKNVRYNKWLKDWTIDPMYPTKRGNDGQIQLMLPIQIKETINEYVFVFDVKYTWKHPELHPKD